MEKYLGVSDAGEVPLKTHSAMCKWTRGPISQSGPWFSRFISTLSTFLQDEKQRASINSWFVVVSTMVRLCEVEGVTSHVCVKDTGLHVGPNDLLFLVQFTVAFFGSTSDTLTETIMAVEQLFLVVDAVPIISYYVVSSVAQWHLFMSSRLVKTFYSRFALVNNSQEMPGVFGVASKPGNQVEPWPTLRFSVHIDVYRWGSWQGRCKNCVVHTGHDKFGNGIC